MKARILLFATLLPIGSISAANAFGAAEVECHLRFPAIREDTLFSNHPVLKDSRTSADMIDFYGECDHNPLGEGEIVRQRQEAQRFISEQ